jgi:hypothetical protein
MSCHASKAHAEGNTRETLLYVSEAKRNNRRGRHTRARSAGEPEPPDSTDDSACSAGVSA